MAISCDLLNHWARDHSEPRSIASFIVPDQKDHGQTARPLLAPSIAGQEILEKLDWHLSQKGQFNPLYL